MIKNYFVKVKAFYNDIKDKLSEKETQNLMRVNKKYFMSGLVVLFTICFFAFNLGGVLKNVWTSLSNLFSNVDGEVKQLVIKSSGYDDSKPGSFKITKTVDWVDVDKAKLVIEIDTIANTDNVSKDIILVVDTSSSMNGEKKEMFKTAAKEFISEILALNDNRIGIISYDSESTILSDFSTDETVLHQAIDNTSSSGETSYYQALINVENMLETYEEVDDRELIVLFVTDGYASIDTANQTVQYKLLKEKYPYVTIQGIQYEPEGVSITGTVTSITIKSISDVTDNQFSADRENIKNVLLEATLVPEYYKSFVITEYINGDYFRVENIDNINSEIGSVTLENYSDGQKISWQIGANELQTSKKATIEIDIKVNDELIGGEGLYSISNSILATMVLQDDTTESVTSEETPILKYGYKVIYDSNNPGNCDIVKEKVETYYAYENVGLSDIVLECDGYQFKGWEIITDVQLVNDETFVMPSQNVTVKAKWSKVELFKGMDGYVYSSNSYLYNVIANQAVMDNVASEYVTSSNGIDFSTISSETNGQGVYTLSSTSTNRYPIHYYRGAVNNNNVIFANYCWKIVRTTETGGVKLIYNGTPTDTGECSETFSSNTALTRTFFNNSQDDSLAKVGYMYNNAYTETARTMRLYSTVLNRYSASNSNYYFSSTATYSDGKYVLGEDASTYLWNDNYGNLNGYYTCRSETSTSCSTVCYVSGSTSSYAYCLNMIDGNDYDDYKFVYSSSYVDNGDGTYTLSDPSTINRADFYKTYFYRQYVCPDFSSTTCSTLYRIYGKNENYRIEAFSSQLNYLYGSSFSYDGTNYTLNDTVEIWDYIKDYNLFMTHRYTCLNKDGVCSNLKFIVSYEKSSRYYINTITLSGGRDSTDALNEMLYSSNVNTKNSNIKEYIDNTWYKNNMTDYTKYLENAVWCNDRTIAMLGNWNPSSTEFSIDNNSLIFTSFYRVKNKSNPVLECPNKLDQFTLKETSGGIEGYGNNALDYPVGLITSDEIILAGGAYGSSANMYLSYSGNSGYYWTMSPAESGYTRPLHFNYNFSGTGNPMLGSYVHPMVSLKYRTEIIDGTGTASDPYVITELES